MNINSIHSPVLAVNEPARPANLTRRTKNLTKKFWHQGQWHLIPLYHLLRLSDLAREGIERSGSYRFADHLYLNRASGRTLLGRLLDRILLNTRAARGMRERCVRSTRHIQHRLSASLEDLNLLAIPCGIPRDVSRVRRQGQRLHYTAMDVDPEVIEAARLHLEIDAPKLLASAEFKVGNALVAQDYPSTKQDVIVSTGLGEFLDDLQLSQFFTNVYAALKPGGTFYTSATKREPGSDYLLNAFELRAHYRSQQDLEVILAGQPWKDVAYEHDETGLQTFIIARK